MSGGIVEFRSKIGAIIVIPVAIVLLLGGPAIAHAVTTGQPLMAVVFSLPIALVAWVLFTIRYTITADHLVIRYAFLRSRIPLPSIAKVRPTRTILSAPALSLDRLEITHEGGIAVISPVDTARFIAEIRARCPQADILMV